MASNPEIKDIDTVQLTDLVREALRSPTAEITHWEHQLVSYINTETSNLGLYRFQGMAEADGEARPWSMVLKAVNAPVNDADPSHWNYHRREILAYQQGLLTDLPGEVLKAPRCLGVTEHPHGICWLWLEDVQDAAATSRTWSLAEYALAARHLGQFNGAYVTGHALPTHPWLSRHWLRGWLEFYDNGCRKTLELIRDESFWEHPLLRSAFPRSITAEMLRLWDNHERLLAALDQLPQTFCHMDAYRPNLFIRLNPQGMAETVAIDWVFAGTGALGEEIANLLAASLIWFEFDAAEAQSLDQAVFSNYMSGLRAANWQGDARLVRLGYTAACALRWGVVGLWWLRALTSEKERAEFEAHWNRPMPELVSQWSRTAFHVLDLAKEADQLQRALL
ncbi:MAG TPA: hypothetical protein VFR47_15920 [Anaerolineales bacterium]|nr:hypothetical protein [Anaerolineales bacterium]